MQSGAPEPSQDYSASSVVCPTPLEGLHHYVFIRPASSALLIIFSGTRKSVGKFDFWNAAKRLSCNVILVNNGRNEWYQNGVPGLGDSIAETANTLLAWKAFLGVDTVCTVGSSMGGYGAILYGAKIGARVLTFGLDTELRAPHSRSLAMMAPDVPARVPTLRPIIAKTATPVTCYIGAVDIPDLMAGAQIKSLPTVTVIALRGVGHASARYVADTNDLVAFLEAFVDDAPLPVLEAEGEMSPAAKRLWLAQDALSRKDYSDVERYARLALQVDPFCEVAMYFLGRAALANSRWQEAVGLLSSAVAITPHYDDAQFQLSNALRRAGDRPRALQVTRDYVRRWPKAARGQHQLAQLLWQGSSKRESLWALATAIGLDPLRADWLDLLSARRAEAEAADF